MNRKNVRNALVNCITTIFALEVRNFFDRGGSNNEIGYSLVKILFIAILCHLVLNMDDVKKIIVEKIISKGKFRPDDDEPHPMPKYFRTVKN
jgi:hypothetical protein